MKSNLAIATLIRSRTIELGLSRGEFAKRLGYKNIAKGIRRIDALCEGDASKEMLLSPSGASAKTRGKTRSIRRNAKTDWRSVSAQLHGPGRLSQRFACIVPSDSKQELPIAIVAPDLEQGNAVIDLGILEQPFAGCETAALLKNPSGAGHDRSAQSITEIWAARTHNNGRGPSYRPVREMGLVVPEN